MGQQQLLLLVLATVIVGLATVAGIQAFDENRTQAAADALTQKGAALAADVKGLADKPAQFGGIDTTSSTSEAKVAQWLGFDNSNGSNVPGAGDGKCTVESTGTSPFTVTIRCVGGSDTEFSDLEFDATYEAGSDPEVSVEPVGSSS